MEKILHPKFMFFLMFVMDVLYNILKEVISLSASHDTRAIATTAVFGAVALFIFLSSVIVMLCSGMKWLPFCSWLVHIIIVEVYFFGDNFGSIIEKYKDQLGCNENCVRINQLVCIGCLGLTLLLLSAIPILHDYLNSKGGKSHHSLWHYFFGVILVLVHINSIYHSTVLSMISNDMRCYIEVLCLSIVFFLMAMCIGLVSIFTNKEIWTRSKINSEWSFCDYFKANCILRGAALILMVTLPLYLLTNNQLPLSYISCGNSTNTSDYSGVETADSTQLEHSIRLAGLVLTAIVVCTVGLVFKCNKKLLTEVELGTPYTPLA